ncbi:hypothetical protein KMZ32_16575 [Phycicoccus sp. MAQZ13P-2]|uniref:hypothetical protein n=1 Tax=Phycicoccus mangrovi TaxID=2840470 RepID=UPI001C00368F|nr:hypothetical protein [Phycicoccus mangrovi]MBT9257433.1 hypothetical protein [Phycicoccus mangrovi]MBT9275693.1 hypothetical protein [Phycicoccus mangrovi]
MHLPDDHHAAHAYGLAILDAVSAAQDGADTMNLAAQRTLEVGAVQVHGSCEHAPTNLTVDVSRAVGGTLVVVQALVNALHAQTGTDRDVIIADTRALVQRAFDPEGA